MSKPVIFIPRPISLSTRSLIKAIEEIGYKVIAEPLVKIRKLEEVDIPDYGNYLDFDEWICVSGLAANEWVEYLRNTKLPTGVNKEAPLSGFPPIWVPGETTAMAIKGYGGKVIIPDGSGTPAIVAGLKAKYGQSGLRGRKIRIVCGDNGARELLSFFGREEASATTSELYEVAVQELDKKNIGTQAKIDYIWITSGSIWMSFTTNFANNRWFRDIAKDAQIIAGSPRIKEMITNEKIFTDVVSLSDPKNESLVGYLKENRFDGSGNSLS